MSDIKVTNNLKGLSKRMLSSTKKGFNTASTDLKRVSSGAAPHKTGFLEKNHMDVEYGSDSWTATIYFEATAEDGFDYAKWTHEADYNLGPGSLAKPGGRSKFTGHVSVGKGYLDRTADQGRNEYINYIKEKIAEGVS